MVIALVESFGLCLAAEVERERVMTALKDEAASIGANAVIVNSSKHEEFESNNVGSAGEKLVLSGKAICFK